jgi:hypothetical protein
MQNRFDVIFIIPKGTSSFFHRLEEDASASTIVYYLHEYGVESIGLYPENERDTYIDNFLPNFEKFIEKNRGKLYCLTCWTESFAFAMDAAKIIRKYDPEGIIVAGGSHFFSNDEIEYTLHTKLVDFVFKGGAEPFLDFARNLLIEKKISVDKKGSELQIRGKLPEKGIYYLSGEKVCGKGSGKFRYPVAPLVGEVDNFVEVRTMLNDTCPNSCDYCVIEHSKISKEFMPHLKDWVKDIIGEIKSDGKNVVFSLSDSSPFNHYNRKETVKFIKDLKTDASFDGMNVFLDPEDLDEDFYKLVDEFNINTFFIGRDRVVEDDFVGRKHNGRLRTQTQLDLEKRSVDNFIDFLNARKKKLKNEIYIGYILSPYEKEEDSNKLISEILEFSSKNSENVKVQSNVFLLNPYPGTKVAKRAEGEYIPNRYFYFPYPNVWIGKTVVNIYFEVVRLIVAKMFCTAENIEIYRPLIQLAHDLQYKRTFNFSYVDDIYDVNMRDFIKKMIEDILSLNFGNESTIDQYFDNILKLYYFGCTLAVVNHKREFLKRGDLYGKIVEKDRVSLFLKKDFETVKNYVLNGKAPVLEHYLLNKTI